MYNVQFIQGLSGLSPWDYSSWRVMKEIGDIAVPANNDWRITLLVKLLEERRNKEATLEDTSRLTRD